MEYASNGKANLGVTLGAIGTGIGVLSGGLNGILGGCGTGWGMNNHCCDSDNMLVNRYEARKDQELAAKDSKIALLESNIYTDQKITDVFERLSTRILALERGVSENTCAQAVTNQKLSDNITFVDSKFDGVYKDIETAKRELKCYVDGTFVPGKLIMPLDSICPPAQPATTPAAAMASVY